MCWPRAGTIHKGNILNHFPGAGEKHIKDRQRPAQARTLEIDAHLLRDEVVKGEHRLQRLPQIDQGWLELLRRHRADVRNVPHRFRAAENVGGGIREERVGVQEIGAAEHVVHRSAASRLRQISPRPGAHPGDLPLLLSSPCGVHGRGMRRPDAVAFQVLEPGSPHWKPREEAGLIVERAGLREAEGSSDQQHCQGEEETTVHCTMLIAPKHTVAG